MTAAVPARPLRRVSPAAWTAALGVLLAVATAGLVPLTIASGQYFNGLVPLVIGVPAAVTGVLAARRQPWNPVGWLLLAMASCLMLGADGGDYSVLTYRLGHHLPFGLVALLLNQLWGPGIFLFGLVILLFPDGGLPSVWWRRAMWAYLVLYALSVAALTVATAGALTGHTIHVDASGGLSAIDHAAGWYGALGRPFDVLILALTLSFVVRQILSWRRSSGERRQQLKWLMSGAVVTLAAPFVVIAGQILPGFWNMLSGIGWLCFAGLPVSIGVAILRYRLYDIDRIISRTLAYAIVTGLLVGVYAGLVLLATEALPVSLSTPVAVAGSTLVAAALFSPLRRGVQRVVDRRFNRSRYDADQTIAIFRAQITGADDFDAVRDDLLGAVRHALEPAHAWLWLDEDRPADEARPSRGR
jgi:hypothetical protein